MKLRRFIFAVFFVGVSAIAQTASPADRSASIDQIVTESMHKQQIPAMTVAVDAAGRISYSKAFGTADLENGIPATTETLIRTGSIAKPISAVAAMTLVESGKLDLDAPVQKYCPQFPVKPWPVTTRELLNHTSGISHYKGAEPESTRHYKSMTDGFSIFANDPLLFEPGTANSYSTYGYTVVGCVVEGASSEKFSDYVAEHVLKPAGMTHTFVDDVFEIIPHRARGYQKIGGQVKNAGLMDSSYKIPGGGYVTTA
ncbi:MAG TPA: serine hydrolase domain-containing protein, partial [Candidatus Angelobacter sp.]|nr:serine hydrolase domain-containing protein [Candidatus Angelobacter sp.]